MSKLEKLISVIIVIATISIMVALLVAENTCDGTLVRGLIWVECLKGDL